MHISRTRQWLSVILTIFLANMQFSNWQIRKLSCPYWHSIEKRTFHKMIFKCVLLKFSDSFQHLYESKDINGKDITNTNTCIHIQLRVDISLRSYLHTIPADSKGNWSKSQLSYMYGDQFSLIMFPYSLVDLECKTIYDTNLLLAAVRKLD
jgi:hypothetical protein